MSGVGGHKSLLDLILEQEENINGLLDVNAFRGSEGDGRVVCRGV